MFNRDHGSMMVAPHQSRRGFLAGPEVHSIRSSVVNVVDFYIYCGAAQVCLEVDPDGRMIAQRFGSFYHPCVFPGSGHSFCRTRDSLEKVQMPTTMA